MKEGNDYTPYRLSLSHVAGKLRVACKDHPDYVADKKPEGCTPCLYLWYAVKAHGDRL